MSGSFGLATYPEDGNTVPMILRAADTMMYEAKVTRDNIAVAGRGTMERPEPPKTVLGSRQAVSGLFIERDPLHRG